MIDIVIYIACSKFDIKVIYQKSDIMLRNLINPEWSIAKSKQLFL